jgi:hypothetical protein
MPIMAVIGRLTVATIAKITNNISVPVTIKATASNKLIKMEIFALPLKL